MRDLLELKHIALLYELCTFFRLADEITAVIEDRSWLRRYQEGRIEMRLRIPTKPTSDSDKPIADSIRQF